MKTRFFPLFLAFAALFILSPGVFNPPGAHAEETAFRKSFVDAKYKNNFAAMKYLIRTNKDKIPAEVDLILKEANAADASDRQRIILIDLAYQISKMHQEWNGGDEKIVARLEAELDKERRKKAAKRAAIAKIKNVELVPGNFVLNTSRKEMEKAGVAPVIYPHWVHRSFFRCKVCHENIVNMKRGANDLSHKSIDSGKVCGTCHNGETSFATTDKKNCQRCHLFDTPGANKLIDLSYYNAGKFTKIADRLKSKWHADKLIEGEFPKGKLGFINWVKLDEQGAFEPLSSLNSDVKNEGVRDTQILFTLPGKFSFMLDNVLWSHKIHSTWINCSICHEKTEHRGKIFDKKAGGTRVSMIEIKEGKSCGTCHGRVSFPVSDCKRCHNHKGTEVDGNTIVRESLKPTIKKAPPEKKKPKPSGLMKSTY